MSNQRVIPLHHCTSPDDLVRAAKRWASRRAKIYRKACFYKPSLTLELDDEKNVLYEVCDLISCQTSYARAVLQLLQTSGSHIVLSSSTIIRDEDYLDDDEASDGTEGTRVVYLLTGSGIYKQVLSYYNAHGVITVKPLTECYSSAQNAVSSAMGCVNAGLVRVIYLVRLKLYYLVCLSGVMV